MPLAIPITIGPGTVGALVIAAAESPTYIKKAETLACIVAACLTVGLMLFVADRVKSVLGRERYRDAFQNHGTGARGPQLSADVHRHRGFPEINGIRSSSRRKGGISIPPFPFYFTTYLGSRVPRAHSAIFLAALIFMPAAFRFVKDAVWGVRTAFSDPIRGESVQGS